VIARGLEHASARRRSRAAIVLASLLVLVGGPAAVVLLASAERAATAPTGSGRIVPGSRDPRHPTVPFFAGAGVRPNGIGCAGEGPVVLRAAAHLDLFADGARVTVPAGIGVLPRCTYWVHTGGANGTISIASPQRRSFTLGDLFDIWGAPLTATRVLSFAVDARKPLRAYVDGRLASGDPRAIRLVDRREITLVVGGLPATLPRALGG
jgi:hypothetical protein